ncbi:melanoma antigen preferentially expressed in tumors-like [Vulpes lagopus]|uniref:melanoma antigen preferentially expressed in tumors-like n=1 Tax=Vulpes lagopus TaxID=494514 RepID=UPI001BC945DD|nr:melanoma antigen preferentially expressed in tumors-like [Vulpes lagopus]
MKMDQKAIPTLLELAAKSLLSNESAAIDALEELPRDLFVPLFIDAFLGGHKRILKAMVRVWPFHCLHIGTLNVQESYYEILEAMIDGLQILSDQNSSACVLQFLDLGCIDHLELNQAYLSEVTTLLALDLCFRDLHIDKMSAHKSVLQFLDLGCIDHLELNQAYLSEHEQWQELETGEPSERILPPQLDALCLSFCGPSNKDITVLSQSSQATDLRLLNLSNNQIFSEVYEPFQTLLEKVSGTLEYLEINNFLITDSTLSAVLPALSHCTHLRVLSFAFKPITMPLLMGLLQCLISLMELKHVIYSVPVHCYEHWNFPRSLDQQKLAEVQTQLTEMLQVVWRGDMNWTTCTE